MTEKRAPQQATQAGSGIEFNASDPEHVRERKSAAAERDAMIREGLRQVMATAPSRAWLHDLIARCGIYRTSFTGNSETYFREGERNIGLRIVADLQRENEDAYNLMCREAKLRGARGFVPKQHKEDENG